MGEQVAILYAGVNGLLQDATQRGARVLTGGQVNESDRYIAPTLIDNIAPGSAILTEEIFGPVLPLATFRDVDEVIAKVNAAPKPLALYVGSRDQANIDRVITGDIAEVGGQPNFIVARAEQVGMRVELPLWGVDRGEHLRRMIRPFVLRRTKTDPEIAGDLPDKIEMKVYCNLSVEQAAMYERATAEMLGQIDAATGIRRRGLILAVLTKM